MSTGINIGSRRSINTLIPTFSRDFVTNNTLNHGIGPNITFTRASSATVFTSTGILSTVPDNVPRFEYGDFRTNYIRNSTMTGAVVGTIGQGGSAPTYWNAIGPTGVSAQIVSVPTVDSLKCIDIRFFGTNTSGSQGDLAVNFETTTQILATSGQTWTGSAYLAVINGSLSGTTNPQLDLIERSSTGSYLLGQQTNLFTTALSSTLTRYTVTKTFNQLTTGRTSHRYVSKIANDSSVDFTLRIGAPQIELSSAATAFIPTTTTAVTTGVPRGLLIEESRTNFVGEQNLLNWASLDGTSPVSAGTGIAGLSSFIIDDTSTTNYHQRNYAFPVPLLSSTTYCFSCFVKKNSLYDNLQTMLRVRYNDEPGNPITGGFAGIDFNQATGALRASSGYTTTSAISTQDFGTFFRAAFTFNTQTTSVPTRVDIIPSVRTTSDSTTSATASGVPIEVAGIQIEQGTFPTSYIPTAGLSATRQADDARVSSVNTSNFFNQEQGTLFMETQYPSLQRFYSGSVPGLWTLDTGAFAQGYGLLYTSLPILVYYTRNLGTNITTVNTFPNTTPSITKTIATISPLGSKTLFFDGRFMGTNNTQYALPPITTFRIGANYIAGYPPVNFFDGYIRKITYWPTRLSNNRLRALTQ